MAAVPRSIRAALTRLWGYNKATNVDTGFRNAEPLVWKASGASRGDRSTNIEGIQVDASSNVRVAKEIVSPERTTITFNLEANAKIADQVFWISDGAYKVEAIYEVHKTKDTDAAAVTATVRKSADGVTIANGTALCTALSLKTTDDTVQTATLSTVKNADGTSVLNLAENDRISLDYSGVTDFAGICVVMVLSPGHKSDSVTYTVVANGDLGERCFYVVPRRQKITAIKYAHTTLGTATGVNVQVTKDTTTDAPGAGNDLLQNDSDAGFDAEAAINTVQDGVLTATAADLILAPGDYLSVDPTADVTALAGVVVTVFFEPIFDRKDITLHVPVDGASIVEQDFFIADRNYEIVAAKCFWDVASAGATNMALEMAVDGTAPGSGTVFLSNDSAAGFQTDGTARTPEVGTFTDSTTQYLFQGEKLGLDPSGTLTALVGLVITVTLKPV